MNEKMTSISMEIVKKKKKTTLVLIQEWGVTRLKFF